MVDLTITGVSGEGNQDFGAYQTVYYVIVYLTSIPPTVRTIGEMHPIGTWKVGEIMLGYTDDGSGSTPAGAVCTYKWFVHHDYEEEAVQAEQLNPTEFHQIFWRFVPGVTANLYVQWTPP